MELCIKDKPIWTQIFCEIHQQTIKCLRSGNPEIPFWNLSTKRQHIEKKCSSVLELNNYRVSSSLHSLNEGVLQGCVLSHHLLSGFLFTHMLQVKISKSLPYTLYPLILNASTDPITCSRYCLTS